MNVDIFQHIEERQLELLLKEITKNQELFKILVFENNPYEFLCCIENFIMVQNQVEELKNLNSVCNLMTLLKKLDILDEEFLLEWKCEQVAKSSVDGEACSTKENEKVFENLFMENLNILFKQLAMPFLSQLDGEDEGEDDDDEESSDEDDQLEHEEEFSD